MKNQDLPNGEVPMSDANANEFSDLSTRQEITVPNVTPQVGQDCILRADCIGAL
jgi:hypothetical protein